MKSRETSFSSDAIDKRVLESSLVESEIAEKIKMPAELLEYLRENLEYGFVGKNDRKLHVPGDGDWNEVFFKRVLFANAD